MAVATGQRTTHLDCIVCNERAEVPEFVAESGKCSAAAVAGGEGADVDANGRCKLKEGN